MKTLKYTALALALAVSAAPAIAKDKKQTFVVVNEEFGLPVFPHDITDREYEVVGEIKAGVRKATVFSKAASQKKIYKELWERARKKGADAVINATYGDANIWGMCWGVTMAMGTAIRLKKNK